MIHSIPLSKLPGQYKALGAAMKTAAVKGVRRGAFRAVAMLHQFTGQAPPANPGGIGSGGAVNTAFYKGAWKQQALPDGARVYNAAPYAGVIEYGRRAKSSFPPKEPIVRWIQRRLGKSEKEARRLSFIVRRAIAVRGLLPRLVLTGAQNQAAIRKAFNDEVIKELDLALAKLFSGGTP